MSRLRCLHVLYRIPESMCLHVPVSGELALDKIRHKEKPKEVVLRKIWSLNLDGWLSSVVPELNFWVPFNISTSSKSYSVIKFFYKVPLKVVQIFKLIIYQKVMTINELIGWSLSCRMLKYSSRWKMLII